MGWSRFARIPFPLPDRWPMALDGGCASNRLRPYGLRAPATAKPAVHSRPAATLYSKLVLKAQGMLQCDNRTVAGHIENFKSIFHARPQRPVQCLFQQVAGGWP